MTMFPSSPSLLFHFSLLHSCAQLWHTDVIWRSRSHFWLVTFSRALFNYLFIDKHVMVIQILPLWKMKTVDFLVFFWEFSWGFPIVCSTHCTTSNWVLKMTRISHHQEKHDDVLEPTVSKINSIFLPLYDMNTKILLTLLSQVHQFDFLLH